MDITCNGETPGLPDLIYSMFETYCEAFASTRALT